MILFNKSINKEKYLCVSYEESYKLQLLGYVPYSRDKDNVYFPRKDNIEEMLKEIRDE